jgi:hypothetical protein
VTSAFDGSTREAVRVAEQIVRWYTQRRMDWEAIYELQIMVAPVGQGEVSMDNDDEEAIRLFGIGTRDVVNELRVQYATGIDALERADAMLADLRSSLGYLYYLSRSAGVLIRLVESARNEVVAMVGEGSFDRDMA